MSRSRNTFLSITASDGITLYSGHMTLVFIDRFNKIQELSIWLNDMFGDDYYLYAY